MIHKFQSTAEAKVQSEYSNYLKTKLNYYNSILRKTEQKDSNIVKNVISNISQKLSEVSQQFFNGNIKLTFRTEVLEIEINSLKEIFKFYAVQHMFLGRAPTFQKISEQSEILDCGTFLAFCKQFLIFYNEKKQKLLHRERLTQIFKRNSTISCFMSFPQFLQAFDSVSKVYFSEEKDLLGQKMDQLSDEEKKVLLFENLRIGDSRLNRKKMKPLSINASGVPIHTRIDTEFSLCNNLNKSKERIKSASRHRAVCLSISSQGYDERKKMGRTASQKDKKERKIDVKKIRHGSENRGKIRLNYRILLH